MTAAIINNSYCPEGKHQVPLEKMIALITTKYHRRMCVDCKDMIMDKRAAIKAGLQTSPEAT